MNFEHRNTADLYVALTLTVCCDKLHYVKFHIFNPILKV